MNKPAAIYARVFSDRQKENHTIASQTAALIQHAATQGYAVPSEWVFQDEGYSGASLVRPGLEAVRMALASATWGKTGTQALGTRSCSKRSAARNMGSASKRRCIGLFNNK